MPKTGNPKHLYTKNIKLHVKGNQKTNQRTEKHVSRTIGTNSHSTQSEKIHQLNITRIHRGSINDPKQL